MTSDTAPLFHLQHNHIGIAIQTNFMHRLYMTRLLALVPQFLARARPVHRLTALRRLRQRFVVHPRHHQHTTGFVILRNGSDETVSIPSDGI